MSGQIFQLNSLMEQKNALERQIEDLRQTTEAILEMTDRIRAEAKDRNIPLMEIALALVPELANVKGKKSDFEPQRRTRVTKRYRNPNNGEVIETKGGNHKGLKEWKAKYGASTVESWLEKND